MGESGGERGVAGLGPGACQARLSERSDSSFGPGRQYACGDYRRQLQRYGLVASMSRKGNCYDNAAMEAFWSTLKREAMEDSDQWTKDRVRRELFEYIEATYNRSRLHSSLDYQSPVDFEQQNS